MKQSIPFKKSSRNPYCENSFKNSRSSHALNLNLSMKRHWIAVVIATINKEKSRVTASSLIKIFCPVSRGIAFFFDETQLHDVCHRSLLFFVPRPLYKPPVSKCIKKESLSDSCESPLSEARMTEHF